MVALMVALLQGQARHSFRVFTQTWVPDTFLYHTHYRHHHLDLLFSYLPSAVSTATNATNATTVPSFGSLSFASAMFISVFLYSSHAPALDTTSKLTTTTTTAAEVGGSICPTVQMVYEGQVQRIFQVIFSDPTKGPVATVENTTMGICTTSSINHSTSWHGKRTGPPRPTAKSRLRI